MDSNYPVKVCVVGPQRAGKTFLCRILSETVLSSASYRPTVGCRRDTRLHAQAHM